MLLAEGFRALVDLLLKRAEDFQLGDVRDVVGIAALAAALAAFTPSASTLLVPRSAHAFFRFEGIEQLIQPAHGILLKFWRSVVGSELCRVFLGGFQAILESLTCFCHVVGRFGYKPSKYLGAGQLVFGQATGLLA